MARLSVWEESESGHTTNKLTFLFIAWVPAERTAYQSCFKVRVTLSNVSAFGTDLTI